MDDLEADIAAVLDLVGRTPFRRDMRKIIGIAGPPGSGKSTLAAKVVARLNSEAPGQAALVPMDGFHMDNDALDRAGLRHVKGAPQTFDAQGFVSKIADLRPSGRTRRFPLFDRKADCTLQDAGIIGAEVSTLIVEGNYLLLSHAPWDQLRTLLQASVMLQPSLETLEQRLLARWALYGLSPEAAYRKTHENDLKNARYVLENSALADLTLTPDQGPAA